MKFITLKIRWILLLILISCSAIGQQPWEKFLQNRTVTYEEALSFYKSAESKIKNSKLINCGPTDSGEDLQLFVISPSGEFNRDKLRQQNKCVVLINNGIHPGEPDGIDASILLVHHIITGEYKIPDGIVLAIVPVYNIDGMLNRSCCTRANQNGPEEGGFRGNGKNLDLNRDFIKCDSDNAKSFNRMYSQWDPDVFADTHTSNGADYTYVMTIIESQKDKLHPELKKLMNGTFTPALYSGMKTAGFPMSPYVNVFTTSPDSGMDGFLETPRYATGYSTLFNALGYVTESHMLKPFPERVKSTYAFLEVLINTSADFKNEILSSRRTASESVRNQKTFPLFWEIDRSKRDSILFAGYKAVYHKSSITGMNQLGYDRNQPYSKYIPYYNTFKATKTVDKPYAYIIPRAWHNVIALMKLNGVKIYQLAKDTSFETESYIIRDYKSPAKPYEGHFIHTGVILDKKVGVHKFRKGDYVVICDQSVNRAIIETLEPEAHDSYFNWNFFDATLQQKEYYSDYLFEPEAAEMMTNNPPLKQEFEKKKAEDPAFAADKWAMLTWFYKKSKYYEPDHQRYPVHRMLNTIPSGILTGYPGPAGK